MLGSLVTAMSQRMVRLGTTALMLSGAGLAGYSYYLDQYAAASPQAGAAMVWVRAHPTLFIGIGVAGIVVGGVLNMLSARRMTKQMMGGMPGGMGGMGGMMGMQGMGGMGGTGGMGGMEQMQAMQALQGISGSQAREVVKVRCKSCSALELEAAAFCSKCGKPMA